MNFKRVKLGDLCFSVKESIKPLEGVNYYHYSFPAFDKNKRPIKESGEQIRSNKFIVNDNMILYNKLNVENKRVWNVKNVEGPKNICSTEFIPLMVNEGVDKDYLYYKLTSDQFTNSMYAARKGTSGSHQRIDETIFFNQEISIPSLKYQEKISLMLRNIDKKIETNNKIVNNLETQAQAIFKSWFIDFEPFQGGNFVESEFGMIPEGWEVKKLGDIFEFRKGKKPKIEFAERKNGSVPYIVKGVVDGTDTPKYTKDKNVVLVDNLDSFMLMDGANSGNIYYGFNGALGSTFSLIEVKEENFSDVLYWYIKINEIKIKNQNTGSAIPHANKDYIYNMLIALPVDWVENDFCEIFETIRIETILLTKQNQNLAQLRDTLLPKLMSGEIRVGQDEIEVVENPL